MTTWMTNPIYVEQNAQEHDYQAPVPRPDQFPESPSESLSYWIRDYPIDFDSQPVPTDVDIIIIGSGISGAAAVYEISLQQPHLRVALIEARGICTGATGRNGGHVSRPECYQLVKTAETWGPEEAIRLKKFAIRNRDMMLACIEDLRAAEEVDLCLNGTVVVFETEKEREEFMKDMEFAQSHEYEPENVYLTPEQTVQKFGLEASLAQFGSAFLQKSGTLHPRKLVHALLQAALERMPSLSIHPHTPALDISPTTAENVHSYRIRTNKGSIATRAVLHATNGYAGSICPSLHGSKGVFGCKAHMLAVQPNVKPTTKRFPVGFGYADFWHWLHQRPHEGPFLYGLAEAELLNDYDDTTTIARDHPARQKMKTFLETIFPLWFENIDPARHVTHDWTGVQGFTMTGASIVGKVSLESPGEFASVGHNGEGMSRCFASAAIATGAMLAYLGEKQFDTPEWFPHTYRRNL